VKGWAFLAVLVACSAVLFFGLNAHDQASDAASSARSRAFVHAAAHLCDSLSRASLVPASAELLRLPDAGHYHRGLVRLALDWRRLAAHPSRAARKQAILAAHHLNVKACEKIPR
jgi:hypothetical protein